jgi:hypothetical protein
LTGVNTQGSSNRGSHVDIDKQFNEIYNREQVIKRAFPPLEEIKDDIILTEVPAVSISLAKRFFLDQEVKVNEDE